jgi:hypothetical protein
MPRAVKMDKIFKAVFLGVDRYPAYVMRTLSALARASGLSPAHADGFNQIVGGQTASQQTLLGKSKPREKAVLYATVEGPRDRAHSSGSIPPLTLELDRRD